MRDAQSQPNPAPRKRSSYRRTVGAFAAAGALALGTVAVVSAQASAPPGSGISVNVSAHRESRLEKDLRHDIESYLKQHRSTERLSAVGLSVSLPGHRDNINVATGAMTFGGHRAVPSDAVWQIGCNTKAFTSVILLQLEAEHRLSIDDQLGKWLPQYPQWRHVTLRSLLNMTSHIATYDEQPAMLNAYVSDPHQSFSKPQLVGYAAQAAPAKKPWSYSNTNYILAEMVIEKVTGTSYSHELYSRIINRLHLKDTFYRPDVYPRSVTEREPAGYFHVRGFGPLDAMFDKDVSRFTMSWTRGAGGIFATLQDMTRWERALYSGRMLPTKQQAELLSLVSVKTGTPVKTSSVKEPNAFGLGVQQSTGGAMGTFWDYEGGTLGTRTLHIYLPKSGVIFAMGLNSYPEKNASIDLAIAVQTTLRAHGLTK
jgi:D-alanyl-D-alanine carboxypeptidase